MNKNELVDAVATAADLKKSEATLAVDAVFEAITGALKKGEEADKAIAELRQQLIPGTQPPAIPPPSGTSPVPAAPDYKKMPAPAYKKGDQVATREAWGTAVAALGGVDPRVVALDRRAVGDRPLRRTRHCRVQPR